MNSKVAAVIVLYNPTINTLSTIKACMGQVSKIFLVDNSEVVGVNRSLMELVNNSPEVQYFSNGGNKGIACALNTGANLAYKEGFEWLLTLDQDTVIPPLMIRDLFEVTKLRTANTDLVGIISPAHGKEVINDRTSVLFTMTSGNLLSLPIHFKIGGFLTELFIDHVDHEYCLRLNSLGYKILVHKEIRIGHQPGDLTIVKIGPIRFSFASHSPVRGYYFFRNGLLVCSMYRKRYPRLIIYTSKLFVKELLKILLETKKWVRLKLAIQGIIDFYFKKFGPYPKI